MDFQSMTPIPSLASYFLKLCLHIQEELNNDLFILKITAYIKTCHSNVTMDIYKKGVVRQKKNHALSAANFPSLLQKMKNVSRALIRGSNVEVAIAKKLIFNDL